MFVSNTASPISVLFVTSLLKFLPSFGEAPPILQITETQTALRIDECSFPTIIMQSRWRLSTILKTQLETGIYNLTHRCAGVPLLGPKSIPDSSPFPLHKPDEWLALARGPIRMEHYRQCFHVGTHIDRGLTFYVSCCTIGVRPLQISHKWIYLKSLINSPSCCFCRRSCILCDWQTSVLM